MGCEDCKKRAKIKINWMIFLGIEVLLTSLYGNYMLFKNLGTFLDSLF